MSNFLLNFGNTVESVSGFHVACFYSQKEAFLNISSSLINSGINSKEQCIVFADENIVEQLKGRIEIEKKDDSDILDNPHKDISYRPVFLSDKSNFHTEGLPDLKKFFLFLEDHINKMDGEAFKKIRFILHTDWLFGAEKGLNHIFSYQKELSIFLKENFGKCILIDCYNTSFFPGTELLKLITYYDGLLIEDEPCASYFTSSRELALTDKLTGLYNEKYLQARIKEEIFRAKRYRGSCSLISIRLDSIEEVRNKHGMSKIDQIFVDFADILRGNLRKVDLISFYNRDCFGILMPETSKKRSFMIAERIKKVFEERLAASEIYKGLTFFLKVGISNFPIDTRRAEELISLASEALEIAMKEKGHIIYSIEKSSELFPPLD